MPSGRYARTAAGTPAAMGRAIDLDEGPIREEGLSAAPTHDYTPLVGDLMSMSAEYVGDASDVGSPGGRLPAPLHDEGYAEPGYREGYSDPSYSDPGYSDPGYGPGYEREEAYDHGSYNQPGYDEVYDHGSYNHPSYDQPGYGEGYEQAGYEDGYGGYEFDRSLSDPVDMGPRPDRRGGIGPMIFGLIFVAGVAAGVAYLLGVV